MNVLFDFSDYWWYGYGWEWDWLKTDNPAGMPFFDVGFNPTTYQSLLPELGPNYGWRWSQAPFGYGRLDGLPANLKQFNSECRRPEDVSPVEQPEDEVEGYVGKKMWVQCFKREFTIADLASVRRLKLRLVRDDGALVWINGHLVARLNVHEPDYSDPNRGVYGWNLAYPSDRRASSQNGREGWPDNLELIDCEDYVLAGILHQGTNQIAVAIFNVSSGSSDVGFCARLEENPEPQFLASPMVFGPTIDRAMIHFELDDHAEAYIEYGPSEGEIDKYTTPLLQGKITDPLFTPHANWKTGIAPFVKGIDTKWWNQNVSTLLMKSSADRRTFYFTKELDLPYDIEVDESNIIDLTLTVDVDDTCVIFINGIEVYRGFNLAGLRLEHYMPDLPEVTGEVPGTSNFAFATPFDYHFQLCFTSLAPDYDLYPDTGYPPSGTRFFYKYLFDGMAFKPSGNQITVAVFNRDKASPDAKFGMECRTRYYKPGEFSVTEEVVMPEKSEWFYHDDNADWFGNEQSLSKTVRQGRCPRSHFYFNIPNGEEEFGAGKVVHYRVRYRRIQDQYYPYYPADSYVVGIHHQFKLARAKTDKDPWIFAVGGDMRATYTMETDPAFYNWFWPAIGLNDEEFNVHPGDLIHGYAPYRDTDACWRAFRGPIWGCGREGEKSGNLPQFACLGNHEEDGLFDQYGHRIAYFPIGPIGGLPGQPPHLDPGFWAPDEHNNRIFDLLEANGVKQIEATPGESGDLLWSDDVQLPIASSGTVNPDPAKWDEYIDGTKTDSDFCLADIGGERQMIRVGSVDSHYMIVKDDQFTGNDYSFSFKWMANSLATLRDPGYFAAVVRCQQPGSGRFANSVFLAMSAIRGSGQLTPTSIRLIHRYSGMSGEGENVLATVDFNFHSKTEYRTTVKVVGRKVSAYIHDANGEELVAIDNDGEGFSLISGYGALGKPGLKRSDKGGNYYWAWDVQVHKEAAATAVPMPVPSNLAVGWDIPDIRHWRQRFYYYTWGDALFISMDCETYMRLANKRPVGFAYDDFQMDWVRKILEKHSNYKWKFLFHHRPIYDGDPAHPKNWSFTEAQGWKDTTDWVYELCKEFGVQAFFFAHFHGIHIRKWVQLDEADIETRLKTWFFCTNFGAPHPHGTMQPGNLTDSLFESRGVDTPQVTEWVEKPCMYRVRVGQYWVGEELLERNPSGYFKDMPDWCVVEVLQVNEETETGGKVYARYNLYAYINQSKPDPDYSADPPIDLNFLAKPGIFAVEPKGFVVSFATSEPADCFVVYDMDKKKNWWQCRWRAPIQSPVSDTSFPDTYVFDFRIQHPNLTPGAKVYWRVVGKKRDTVRWGATREGFFTLARPQNAGRVWRFVIKGEEHLETALYRTAFNLGVTKRLGVTGTTPPDFYQNVGDLCGSQGEDPRYNATELEAKDRVLTARSVIDGFNTRLPFQGMAQGELDGESAWAATWPGSYSRQWGEKWRRALLPGLENGTDASGRCYHYAWGDAAFICLSGVSGQDVGNPKRPTPGVPRLSDATKTWLVETLQHYHDWGYRWKFIVDHTPTDRDETEGEYGPTWLRSPDLPWLEEVMDKYGVQVFWCGHTNSGQPNVAEVFLPVGESSYWVAQTGQNGAGHFQAIIGYRGGEYKYNHGMWMTLRWINDLGVVTNEWVIYAGTNPAEAARRRFEFNRPAKQLTMNHAGDTPDNPIIKGFGIRAILHKTGPEETLRHCWITTHECGGGVYTDLTGACVDEGERIRVDIRSWIDLDSGKDAVLNVIHFTTSNGHVKAGIWVAEPPPNKICLDGYNGEDMTEPVVVPLLFESKGSNQGD